MLSRVVMVVCVLSCDAGERTPPRPAPPDDPPPVLADDVPLPERHEPNGPPPSFRAQPYRAGAPILELNTGGAGFAGRWVTASVSELGILTIEGGHERCHVRRIIPRERLAPAMARLAALFDRDPNSPSCEGGPGCGSPDLLTVRVNDHLVTVARGDNCPGWIGTAFDTAEEIVAPKLCR